MAVDQFGNELTEEELYELMLQQQQMGLRPHPARVKGFATPPAINYSQVMEDWSDPAIVSAPAFDVPRPATTADVTPVDPALVGMSAVPLAAGIRRPGRRGPRTLTPEQIAVRDANRLKVENQQLSRNIARSDAAYAREVPAKGVPLQEALAETPEEKARRVQAEKTQALSARKGTGVVKAIAPFAKAVPFAGGLYEALRSEPAVASELAPGVIPGDFRVTQAYPSMDNVYTDPTAMAAGIASVAEEWNLSLIHI